MNLLARTRDGIFMADLHHLERPEGIATWLIETSSGLTIVDPGPSSCGERLRESVRALGASMSDLRHILLTHIHLDHAGISGTLLREFPRARVYVHARGAPHLADPARLLASALMLYGDSMERLWGEVLPIPRDQIVALDGGERLTLGDLRLVAGYTPGHAVHHLAYLEEREGVVWTGDVAGEASQHDTPALPVSPPPDIDLPAWRSSLDLIESWAPEELLLTHFGPVAAPSRHIAEMWSRLVEWSEIVRESLEQPGSDDLRADRFADEERARLTAGLPEERATHVEHGTIRSSWFGLARYWRKEQQKRDAVEGTDA
jgi:glyoxylase-like metal-dependent hydrolase (beta-lactamase superfamily II)